MAVKTNAVTVGTTATLLTVEADTQDIGQLISYFNDGAVVVHLGGADVAATGAHKGTPLAAGAHLHEQLPVGSRMYGIVATGTCSVIVRQSGV